ncbi:unnamed protein product, partial [Coregonus sp. 'balchen']
SYLIVCDSASQTGRHNPWPLHIPIHPTPGHSTYRSTPPRPLHIPIHPHPRPLHIPIHPHPRPLHIPIHPTPGHSTYRSTPPPATPHTDPPHPRPLHIPIHPTPGHSTYRSTPPPATVSLTRSYLQMTDTMDNLEQLLQLNGGDGQIFTMEGQLCLKSVQSMFGRLIDAAYSPFPAVLRCGNLASDVQVFPRPEPVFLDEEIDPMPRHILTDLEIVGFIEIGDISSPPVMSRHLVLPIAVNKEWYGMLYSQADSKKKSNLMMSLFEPGPGGYWLARCSHFDHVTDAAENPYGEDDSKSPFPLQPKIKRSYAQNVTVWIKASGLQTDVQKILRNARKLPEKTQTFYKELNRLRKAALAFGFWELLKGVSELLERECTLLPDTAHPDAAFQLSHAAQQLKLASTGDSQYAAFDHNINPMHTDFSGGGAGM